MEKELFYDYFQNWFEVYREPELCPVTKKKYYAATKTLKRLVPNLYVEDITRRDMQKLINLYGKDHALGTVKGFYHMIKACTDDAVWEGTIKIDPAHRIRLVSSKELTATKAKYLEKDQAERLIEVLEKHDDAVSTLFDFDIRTGLRFAELLGLTPKDIDLEKGTINVNKSWLYKLGKNAKFGETKNMYSHRVIPIDELAKNDLKKYIADCDENEPIFVVALTKESTRKPEGKYLPIYDSTLNHRLAQMCHEARVPRIGIHGLRHTHASLLFSAGISILSISKRLGHGNTSTTEKVYVHLINAQKDKDTIAMMNALNELGTKQIEKEPKENV